MGEVEGENDSGRSWPRAIDMFENGLTAYQSAWGMKTEHQSKETNLC